MTRFFYFILPVVIMLAFAGFYFGVFYKGHVAEVEAAERIEAEKVAKEKAEKEKAEATAAADATARAEQKREDDRKKREDREKRQADEDKLLRDRTEEAETRAANLSKTRADLEIQLAETRRSREAEERKAFDLRREVEQMKITRRNAELAIQLDTEKIAVRVEASSMVQEPIFVKPPATEKEPAR